MKSALLCISRFVHFSPRNVSIFYFKPSQHPRVLLGILGFTRLLKTIRGIFSKADLLTCRLYAVYRYMTPPQLVCEAVAKSTTQIRISLCLVDEIYISGLYMIILVYGGLCFVLISLLKVFCLIYSIYSSPHNSASIHSSPFNEYLVVIYLLYIYINIYLCFQSCVIECSN